MNNYNIDRVERAERMVNEIAAVEKIQKIADSQNNQVENQLRDEAVGEQRLSQPQIKKTKTQKRLKHSVTSTDIDNVDLDDEFLLEIIRRLRDRFKLADLDLDLRLERTLPRQVALLVKSKQELIKILSGAELVALYRRESFSKQGISLDEKGWFIWQPVQFQRQPVQLLALPLVTLIKAQLTRIRRLASQASPRLAMPGLKTI